MKIAPVKRCASLAECQRFSPHHCPDNGLITPGDASPGGRHRGFISTPDSYLCPTLNGLSGSLWNRS
ncbi:hypothetical protein [Kosakonia cowanii]|uniref:hypothetical protein n=1 Tax=Kosakonia cowanii TaxID=208223 RepID=UPI0003F94B1E|nr:hypothetical protein [Kosakonia cowanii]